MATTTKLMARTSVPVSGTTVYTATSTAVVTNIAICNPTSSAATFSIQLGYVSLQEATSLAAKTTAYIDLKQVMANTDSIWVSASTSSVTVHISGIEIS